MNAGITYKQFVFFELRGHCYQLHCGWFVFAWMHPQNLFLTCFSYPLPWHTLTLRNRRSSTNTFRRSERWQDRIPAHEKPYCQHCLFRRLRSSALGTDQLPVDLLWNRFVAFAHGTEKQCTSPNWSWFRHGDLPVRLTHSGYRIVSDMAHGKWLQKSRKIFKPTLKLNSACFSAHACFGGVPDNPLIAFRHF